MMKVWTQTLVTDMNDGKTEKVTERMETEYPKAPATDKSFIQLSNLNKKQHLRYLVKSCI